MAKVAALVFDKVQAKVPQEEPGAIVRADELPRYVSSPRAGWAAYLAYCQRTRMEGTPRRLLEKLSLKAEGKEDYIRLIAESITQWQKELNTARANIKRYEKLIAEGVKVDPKDLAVYAQEFDSIANLDGVSEIGISKSGRLFVIFKSRRQLENGGWCDFGDWKIYPGTVRVDRQQDRGREDYDGEAIRLRSGVVSRDGAYPHDREYFCWGNYNGVMSNYTQKGRFFEMLSHVSVALMTFSVDEASSAPCFKQLTVDDRPKKVTIDPAARQHYIDAKTRIGSNHVAALEEAKETATNCSENIETYGRRVKTERVELEQLRREIAENERLVAEGVDPEIAWRQEFEEILGMPEVLAVEVYDYDDQQSLKFVIRAQHQTPQATYYLGDYRVDFMVSRYGLERLEANRLKTGLIPGVEDRDPTTIHHGLYPRLRTDEILRFRVDNGELLGMLRAIIQHLSTPGNLQNPEKLYLVL